jgi:hypothetical protein
MAIFLPIALLIAVLAFGMAQTITPAIARQQVVAAGASAAGFSVYQGALMAYKSAHPAFSGSVPQAALSLPPGVTSVAGWDNLIAGGVLYVYSTHATKPAERSALLARATDPTALGTVTASGVGRLVDGNTLAVPSAIPLGATFAWMQ